MKAWFGERMSEGSRWFARLHADRLGRRDGVKFLRWLDRDAEHERELVKREVIWDRLGDLRDDPQVQALVRDTLARTQRPEVRVRSRTHFLAATLAAAAVAAVAVALWISNPTGSAVQQAAYAHTFETKLGEQSSVVLPEGSEMILNSATRVSVVLGERERTVVMEEGEAIFQVTHDSERPFQVVAGGAVARVLGTRFNVRRVGERTDVSVLHGQVQVSSQAEPEQQQQLTAGKAVTFENRKLGNVVEADLERISAWQSRRIEFHDTSLASAVEEFNRYSTTQITIGDDSLLETRISGGLRFGDVEALTRTLHSAFGIESERTAEGVRLMPPRQGADPNAGPPREQ